MAVVAMAIIIIKMIAIRSDFCRFGVDGRGGSVVGIGWGVTGCGIGRGVCGAGWGGSLPGMFCCGGM